MSAALAGFEVAHGVVFDKATTIPLEGEGRVWSSGGLTGVSFFLFFSFLLSVRFILAPQFIPLFWNSFSTFFLLLSTLCLYFILFFNTLSSRPAFNWPSFDRLHASSPTLHGSRTCTTQILYLSPHICKGWSWAPVWLRGYLRKRYCGVGWWCRWRWDEKPNAGRAGSRTQIRIPGVRLWSVSQHYPVPDSNNAWSLRPDLAFAFVPSASALGSGSALIGIVNPAKDKRKGKMVGLDATAPALGCTSL